MVQSGAAVARREPMDITTIERFIESRDPELFREIVEEYQDRVFRLVASILGPWADRDAEEITQDIFLKIYRKCGQFRGESAFSSWIYRVAYTTALNHRQTARIRFPHQSEEPLLSLKAESDPLGEILAMATKRRVAGAVESLPDLYRTVIYLYYWQDHSIAEVSEAVGAPEGTVKSYLYRARERIRRELEKESGR